MDERRFGAVLTEVPDEVRLSLGELDAEELGKVAVHHLLQGREVHLGH